MKSNNGNKPIKWTKGPKHAAIGVKSRFGDSGKKSSPVVFDDEYDYCPNCGNDNEECDCNA